MGNILYLVHRIPFPPDKGDKVRSYHLLKHLTALHRVFLGTFIDDPEDEQHLATLQGMCVELKAVRLRPKFARLRSLAGFISGTALTLPYYGHAGMRRWVNDILSEHQIDSVVVFSAAMAQYLSKSVGLPILVDFVDVDSEKWADYANIHYWPLSWLYRRESKRLLCYETELSMRATHSFFVTENETRLFRNLSPESSMRVSAMSNGVDCDYFSPDPLMDLPFVEEVAGSIVFTGAMDYEPNVDAVRWFAQEVLPKIREHSPHVRFYVVGRNPLDSVLSLSSDAVQVTGTVADVRPYLQHAAVVVAPLRVARGIQNKILEAMAMEKPVVASAACVSALDSRASQAVLSAVSSGDFVSQVEALLGDPDYAATLGRNARKCVLDYYSWDAHMAAIDPFINAPPTETVNAVRASQ